MKKAYSQVGRALLVCMIGLLIMDIACAQKSIPVSISPKIGVNFSDLVVSRPGVDATLAKLGWNIGVDVRYGNRFAGNAGMHFFRTGAAIRMRAEDSPALINSSQLKAPLMLGYQFLKVDYFKLWLKGGLVLNYTLRVVEDNPVKVLKDFDAFGLGTRLGVAMDLGRFNLEINYERSHSDLFQDVISAQNKLFSIGLGIRI